MLKRFFLLFSLTISSSCLATYTTRIRDSSVAWTKGQILEYKKSESDLLVNALMVKARNQKQEKGTFLDGIEDNAQVWGNAKGNRSNRTTSNTGSTAIREKDLVF